MTDLQSSGAGDQTSKAGLEPARARDAAWHHHSCAVFDGGECNCKWSAATTPRHPATEKAWAWLDAEEETMALEPMRRARIEEALRLIDATFIAWDEEVGA